MIVDLVKTRNATLIDSDNYFIQLEAAISKIFASEAAWNVTDEAIQVKSGIPCFLPMNSDLTGSWRKWVHEGSGAGEGDEGPEDLPNL